MTSRKHRRSRILASCVLALILVALTCGCAGKLASKTAEGEKDSLADELHARGLMLWHEKKYKEAIDFWQKELEVAPERVKPYNNIGLSYRKLGDLDAAIKYHEKAINAAPSFGHTYYSLGLVYFDRKDYKKVKELLHRAIELGYINADVYYTLGQARKFDGEYELAAESYEKAAELYYAFPGVHYGLGESYRKLGKLDLARLEFQKEISLTPRWKTLCRIGQLLIDTETDPTDAEAFFKLGMLQAGFESKEYQLNAVEAFKKVIELDTSYQEAHYQLGLLYEKERNYAMAEYEYLREFEVNPENAVAQEAAGYLHEFEFSEYKVITLEEIGEHTGEVSKEHESGVDFYQERYRVRVRLKEYPHEISEYALKTLSLYWRVLGSSRPLHRWIFTHQLDSEAESFLFTLVFQEHLIRHLKEKVKPEDLVDLYVVLGVYDYSKGRTTLLVDEFSAVEAQPAYAGTMRRGPRRTL